MKAFLLVLATLISTSAEAEYFTVSEVKPASEEADGFQGPSEIAQAVLTEVQNEWESLKVPVLNLLSFRGHQGSYGETPESYNRMRHFGTWLRDSHARSCLNTRGHVLERDSQGPVSYTSHGCTVTRGQWHDPYSDADFTYAEDVQIDHVVPLKNAYISGAGNWNYKKRCLYANFLGNSYHLMTVKGDENMRKSDKSPAEYIPPNGAFTCEYLQNWLKIKLIWALNLSSFEKNAIQALAQQSRCDIKGFQFSETDLQTQRQFIADNMSLCQ